MSTDFVWTLEDFKTSLEEKGIRAGDIESLVVDEFARNPRRYVQHPKLEALVKERPKFAWMLVKRLADGASISQTGFVV